MKAKEKKRSQLPSHTFLRAKITKAYQDLLEDMLVDVFMALLVYFCSAFFWFSLFLVHLLFLPLQSQKQFLFFFMLLISTYVSTNFLQMNSRLLRNPWISVLSNSKWRRRMVMGIKMFEKCALMWGWYSRTQWNITNKEMMSTLWQKLCWINLRQNGCSFFQKLTKRY